MTFESHMFWQNHIEETLGIISLGRYLYTVRRALPLFLRVLITLLPVWDLILTLKPETLFLFRLVPPKVLFVISIYARIELVI